MTLEELLRQGKSFGQGASNSAASTVTGPVDMLAWLLRKGGVNVGDAPMGGEAWMRQKGLMATPENRLAGLLGEGAGLAAPIVAAAKAPEIAGGLLQIGRNLAAPQTLNKQTGAIVYHGSPHKFDKFDSSKIGTGEGAQAYGHGLYLAESPDVAGQYAKNIMGPTATPENIALKVINATGDESVAAMRLKQIYPKMTDVEIGGAITNAKGYQGNTYKVDLPDEHIAKMLDWDKPLSQQPQAFKDAVSAREQQRMMPILEQRRATLAGLPQGAENASILKKQIAILEDEITQPQAVPNMTGGEYFNYLRNREMAPAEQADWLRKAGIPGIRYLDGGSRMKTGGELIDVSQKNGQWFSKIRKTPSGQVGDVIPMAPGFTTSMPFKTESEARQWAQQQINGGTSNFVVFPGNEGLLKILERNGGKP